MVSRPSSSGLGALQASNSRISLVLTPPPPSTSFHPGDVLRSIVTLHGDHSYTSLSLRLVGQTHAVIMGKDRWQAGQLMNLSMGAPGMVITSIEEHAFLDASIPLVGPEGAWEMASKGDEKRGSDDADAGGGVYEVQLPFMENGELLPTFVRRIDDSTGAGVKYTLELLGKRKGLFKLDDKLSLEIPVSIPVSPPVPLFLPPALWPQTTRSQDLKFKSADSVTLLALSASLSYHPLARASSTLLFSIRLTAPPHALSLLSGDSAVVVSSSLARRVRTTPIDDPSKGKEMDWAGLRIAQGKMVKAGDWGWEGRIEVPDTAKTVLSAGLGVQYFLGCHISSPALDGALVLHVPVFCPSSLEVEEPGVDAPGERVGELPTYSA